MMSLRKLGLVAVMGGLALLFATGPAQAEPFLWLGSTGGGDSGVQVGGGGNPAQVQFTGALPGDTLLSNITVTGISEHNPGGATGSGTLDLNAVTVAVGPHSGTDTLHILLSDTDFVGPTGAGELQLALGGTLAGGTSLTASAKKDPSNSLWGGLTLTVPPGILSGDFTGQLGPFTNPAPPDKSFSGDTSVPHPALGGTGTYSLTDSVTLTFEPSLETQTVSFNFHTHNTSAAAVVPEPASMTLLGIGLSGLFTFRRFLRRAFVA